MQVYSSSPLKRIAIVVSHPIQHFCPQYASMAKNEHARIKVFFASTLGYRKYVDPDFKQEVIWGDLKLERFEHCFLNGDQVLQPDRHLDAPNLDAELDAYSPDVVIIYGYYQKLQRRARTWGVARKVSIAYIADSERRQRRNRVKEVLKKPFLLHYFSGISFFLTVGDANEDYYRYYGVPDTKLIRMHFPIDLSSYQRAFERRSEYRTSVRQSFKIPDSEIVLSVVGKLVSWKNQVHIIKAMQILEKQGLYLHLFILGSGEMMELCKSEASVLERSVVHFPGFVPAEQLPEYYSATDIYVHPAEIEPHSLGISEAVYMGCPVIISDRCGSYGSNDDVQDGENGYVYPFGDILALTEKIRILAGDQAIRTRFSTYSHSIGVKFQQRSHVETIEIIRSKLSVERNTNP